MNKESLEQLQSIRESIVDHEGRLEELKKQKAEIVSDTVMSSAEHPYYPHPVKIEGKDIVGERKRLERIDKLMQQITDMQNEAIDLESEIMEFIQGIKDHKLKRVFLLKYVGNKSWEQIGQQMHVDESTARKWVDRYLNVT